MKIAKTITGEWIDANKASPHDIYYCAKCGHMMKVRKTKSGMTFYHLPHHTQNRRYNNESLCHKEGKAYLKQWFQSLGYDVVEEYPFSDEQRSDLLVLPNMAIELQRSPLSYAHYKKRHEGYQAHHLHDFWLLVPPYYEMRSHYYPFLSYHPTAGFYYYTYDQQHFDLHYHVTSQDTECVMSITQFPFPFPVITKKRYNTVRLMSTQQQELQRRLLHPSVLLKKLQWQWYKRGCVMQQYPPLWLPLSLPFCSLEMEWQLKTAYLFDETWPKDSLPVPCADAFWRQFVKEYERRLSQYHRHVLPPFISM